MSYLLWSPVIIANCFEEGVVREVGNKKDTEKQCPAVEMLNIPHACAIEMSEAIYIPSG